ncbi:GNAT family N-acetyltransferase [Roseomonas elaeocarpi]|uniref:GNAT family N-acetyltransferase n=1 Tax=Roseomonas elaeocarpi TaxID=907779 RepID=A0ABV6JNA6_9PROT
MDSTYSLIPGTPTVEDYCRLRIAAGLTPRSDTAARAALPNTIVGVVVRHGGAAVGMGRVLGDGLFYQLVDIAVEPDHQGRGLGKAIVGGLMDALKRQAPAEAHVSLMADGQAYRLYEQFGFRPTAPASIGMAQWIGR